VSSKSLDSGFPPPTVGALLRLAWLRFRERIYQRVQEAGYTDLLPMHVMLFRYPTIEGLRPTQLAEQAGLSKQAMNDLLRQLESMGYLERRRDPADGRARLITLTGRGQRLMDLLYRVSSEIAEEWEQQVGKARLDALRATLVEIVDSERQNRDQPTSRTR
jgi:DNA-binding MarR family transcriptional regulator